MLVVREDMFTPDSVEHLQKAGLDFQRHEEFGIIPNDFAELMITSGMLLSYETQWIRFTGACVFTSPNYMLSFIPCV